RDPLVTGVQTCALPISRESLHVWRERLQLLAADPQVKGVIVTIGDLQAGLPAIESLRRSLLAFRTSGKRLIAFLVTANLYTYYRSEERRVGKGGRSGAW